jgi:hypothetical protein
MLLPTKGDLLRGCLVACAALIGSGCFRSPTPDVARMICQQDVDCFSGYVCRVKGIPGGCCKPDDKTCGFSLDGATADVTYPIDISSGERSSWGPEATVDLASGPADTTGDRTQISDVSITLDQTSTSPDLPHNEVLVDLVQPTERPDVPIRSDLGEYSDAVSDFPTTPDIASEEKRDSTTPTDPAKAELGCVVTSPGTCCSLIDCVSGGVGTVPACNSGVCSYPCDVATHKDCAGACIPRGDCCDNADCSGATPECTAGTCVGGTLSVKPSVQSFGSILVGEQSPPTTFLVSNTGAGKTGKLSSAIAGTTEFTITSNACTGTILDPNASCDISVRLAPASVGTKTATLQVDGNPGGSVSSNLQGNGQAPAALAIEPSSYVFPTTITGGATSTAVTFTVRNTGSVAAGTAVGLAETLIGTNPSEFGISTNTCAASLGQGNACSVVIIFKPALLSSGAKAATLSVTATPGGPATANLAATAQECDTSAHCTVPNRPICIGNVCRGCASGSSGGRCGGSSIACDVCSAKNPNTEFCDGDPASPMYDRCVECDAQITCNEWKAYCSPATKTCVPCTQAPDPDSACDHATSAAYNHCVLAGDRAGECIHAQCTTDTTCKDEEYFPGLPYCNNCSCSATPGAVICP